MPRPYARLRESTFDLYVERDLLPGYYKLIATGSTWLILAGYVLFAVSFTNGDDNLNATRRLITAIGSTFLVAGYAGVLVVALICRSLLFLIDGVITPTLTSSILGLFTTLANWLLQKHSPASQVYMSIPLVTACVTTVVSIVILVIAYRELGKIRRLDQRKRWHLQMGPYAGTQTDTTPTFPIPGEDEAAQRRQLMQLLHNRQEGVFAQEQVNNTFKIDLPIDPRYQGRGRHEWTRAPSHEKGRFSITNLIPWRKPSANTSTFQDARERRREEIERSSVQSLGETWRNDSNAYAQPPSWGWPPATRYA